MKELAIFDFGGVIHGLEGGSIIGRISDTFGVTKEEIRPFLIPAVNDFSTGKTDEMQFWEKMSKSLGKPFPQNWHGVWRSVLEENKLYPEAVKLAEDLKKGGIRTAVLSNTVPPHADFNRERGWYKYFDKIYLSYEIGLRKPDIAAYEYVLKDQNISGSQCIFVDDLEENLVPARTLGMETVLAGNPVQMAEEVKKKVFG